VGKKQRENEHNPGKKSVPERVYTARRYNGKPKEHRKSKQTLSSWVGTKGKHTKKKKKQKTNLDSDYEREERANDQPKASRVIKFTGCWGNTEKSGGRRHEGRGGEKDYPKK